MIIAESLLLLGHDDASGSADAMVHPLDVTLVGAILVDLHLLGRIAQQDTSSQTVHLEARDATPTAHPELDAALAVVAERPCSPAEVVARVSAGLRDRLLDGLVHRGVLRRQEKRVLGLVPTTRWPTVDPAPEAALRAGLVAVLLDGALPTPHQAALLVLTERTWLVRRLVPVDRRREAGARARARARARAIVEDYRASGYLEGTEQGVAAVVAAVVLTTVLVQP